MRGEGGGETMADKLKHIPNDDTHDTPSVDYNWWLKRLVTELNEPTHQSLIKVPKVVEPTNKKTLGTSVINSPMSSLSLSIQKLNPELFQ